MRPARFYDEVRRHFEDKELVHRHRQMTHRRPTASQGFGRCARFVNPPRVGIMGSRSREHSRSFQLRSKNGLTIGDVIGTGPEWTWSTPPKICPATNGS